MFFLRKAKEDTYTVSFDKVEVQGGGRLILQSNGELPMILIGTDVEVHSGGIIEADNAIFQADTFTLHHAGVISANHKVTCTFDSYSFTFRVCH